MRPNPTLPDILGEEDTFIFVELFGEVSPEVPRGPADGTALAPGSGSAAPPEAPPELPDAAEQAGTGFDLSFALSFLQEARANIAGLTQSSSGAPGQTVATTDFWFEAKGGNGGGGGGESGPKGGKGGSGPTDPNVLASYVSGAADGAAGYDIEIVFKGTWTADLQKAFLDAAEFLSDVILGDVQDVVFRRNFIDDIRIEAKLSAIDGTGGILGQAGPTAYRTADYLPAVGVMEFDSADAQDFFKYGENQVNLWKDIVFHEMMHVIGFGTMWDLMGLVTSAGDQLEFNGANATAANDYTAPLIETDGGPGTAGGHWDEATYRNEVMTGYINDTNVLSKMSVAALEDMGYDTVWDMNDAASTGWPDYDDLIGYSDPLLA